MESKVYADEKSHDEVESVESDMDMVHTDMDRDI